MNRLNPKVTAFLIMILSIGIFALSGCGERSSTGGVPGTGGGVPLAEVPVTLMGAVDNANGAAGAPERLAAPLAGYAVVAKNASTGVTLSGDPAITDSNGNFILSFKIPLDQDISIVIVAQDPDDATGATIMRAILPISSADLQTLINQFQGHPVLTVGMISPTSEQLVLAMEIGLGLAPGSLGTIAVFKTATEINDEAANGNKFVLNGVDVVVQGTVDDGIAGTGGIITQLGDYFGPPPADDPSAFTGPFIGLEFAQDLLATLPLANEGAFEGPGGTLVDNHINNSVPEAQQDGGSKVPTNSKPSPLFGALPFEQQMILFEEFGPERLDPNGPVPANGFPVPTTGPAPFQDTVDYAKSSPDPVVLEAFLAQAGIAPFPTELANTAELNPWKLQIENYLGRLLAAPPAEGRPPGRGWAHQRWNEFQPQVFFKTAQAGARVNGGHRDSKQRHGYSLGEFGPDGLYHNVYSFRDQVVLGPTTNGLGIRFHPNMPLQDHKALWTFDGTLPPKLLQARHGQAVLMRHYNALPIDPSANRGFGMHTMGTHEHNGRSPGESDGFANAFFFPGQFYDYRWPLQLAGYDTINTIASDPRAAFPCEPGETLFVNDANPGLKTCTDGRIQLRGDWRETMSTHWFHDHMEDATAQNVYKGNAAMMNYYSALDRGNEAVDDGVNLRFPSGTALPWGNRDYDVNLLVADKAWDQEGQLWFNPFNHDGFLGDVMTANWLYNPYFDVRARSYRFRILNGAVSRFFAIALVHEVNGTGGEMPGPAGSGVSYNRVPFYLIANDGNVMEHAVPLDGTMDLSGRGNPDEHKGQLPTQMIAERYDIIVDFSKHGIQPGDKLYFVNVLEHDTGQKTNGKIPLADILSETYKAELRDDDGDGIPDRWINGDPVVGKFLELRVKAYTGTDLSMNPAEYIPGGKTMIPLTIHRDDPADQAKLANARHRTFSFDRGGDVLPWTISVDGGPGFNMDPRRISAAPQISTGPTDAGFAGEGTLEVWTLTGGGGWDHPVHIHFEEGIILSQNGGEPPAEWEKWTRKDMYGLGPDEDNVRSYEIAIRVREFTGNLVQHCHNTMHEDNAMLLRWVSEYPGQLELMPAPIPTWDGIDYVDSAALPTFRVGDGIGPQDPLP